MLIVVLKQQSALSELTYEFLHEKHCSYFHSSSLYKKISNSYIQLVLLNMLNVAASSLMISTQIKIINSMNVELQSNKI